MRLAPLPLCLLAGALASVWLGQDANWDLRNYHLYNPWALLTGRFRIDVLPAGLQTTLNPLLDLPYYLLASGPLATRPALMAAVAGLPLGLLLFATAALARWALDARDGAARLLPWLAAAIAGTAAGTASEIGTTFNDIQLAVLVVGALAVGAPAALAAAPPVRWRLACAGLLLGAAVALKPTSLVFVPGAFAALLVAAPGFRTRAWVLLLAGAGAALGFAVLAGPWMLVLYQRWGSPTFPLMNGLFRSPWYPPLDFYDNRFLPRSTLQAWFYPLWWVRANHGLVTEVEFRDARMALALLALPVLTLGLVRADPGARRRMLALLVAALLGYAAWLRTFAILRYALALEAFAAILLVAALRELARLALPRTPAAAPVLAAMVLGGLLWHTQIADWGRVPFTSRVFDIEAVTLPPGSLVVAVEAPVAMVIPFLDTQGGRAVGITHITLGARGYALFDETMRIIHGHAGPVFAVVPGRANLASVPPEAGLAFDPGECRPIRANVSLATPVELCPARRTGAPPGP